MPRRDRKLLLHKREIEKLTDILKHGGLTIVPLSLYFKDGKAKVEIAVAKGKKAHDKRNTLKEKEASREVDREISRRISGKSDRTGGRVGKAMGIKKGGKSSKSGGSKLSGKSARYADYE